MQAPRRSNEARLAAAGANGGSGAFFMVLDDGRRPPSPIPQRWGPNVPQAGNWGPTVDHIPGGYWKRPLDVADAAAGDPPVLGVVYPSAEDETGSSRKAA